MGRYKKIDWQILFQATKFATEKTCQGWGLWGRKKNCRRTKTKGNGRKKKKKKKEQRHAIATKNKELKQIKKAEKNKRDKQEIWARLKKLNNNFAKMKEQTKLVKKKKLYFS